MSFAPTSRRGACLNARFAVNGIQCASSGTPPASTTIVSSCWVLSVIASPVDWYVTASRHPVRAGLAVPFGRRLPCSRPQLERAAPGDVPHPERRVTPAAEAEGLARHRDADVHPDHPRGRALGH